MEQVPWLLVGFIVLLNFGISFWNARVCGLVWVETKEIGRFSRFMTWMGAIMSASGFTYCYLVVLLFGAYFAQFSFLMPGEPPVLDQEAIRAGFALGYLMIIPGILFSGLMIWIDSLVQAWRRRDLPSMGTAAWNTFAQVHNTYSAMRGMPEAWGAVSNFFSSKSGGKDAGKAKAMILVIILVVVAALSGILTTWAIIAHYAGTRPIENVRARRTQTA